MCSTSGQVSDIAEASTPLHGRESEAFGDMGYQGVEKHPDASEQVTWRVTMPPENEKLKIRGNALDTPSPIKLNDAKGQYQGQGWALLLGGSRRQLGFVKVRYIAIK